MVMVIIIIIIVIIIIIRIVWNQKAAVLLPYMFVHLNSSPSFVCCQTVEEQIFRLA